MSKKLLIVDFIFMFALLFFGMSLVNFAIPIALSFILQSVANIYKIITYWTMFLNVIYIAYLSYKTVLFSRRIVDSAQPLNVVDTTEENTDPLNTHDQN